MVTRLTPKSSIFKQKCINYIEKKTFMAIRWFYGGPTKELYANKSIDHIRKMTIFDHFSI